MNSNNLLKCPSDYEKLPNLLMSNFDHIIDKEVEAKLKIGKYKAAYVAMEFFSYCWWNPNESKFYAEVWRYGSHVDTIYSETAQGIMDALCEEWGSD